MEILVEQIQQGEFLHTILARPLRDWALDNIGVVRLLMIIYAVIGLSVGWWMMNNIFANTTALPSFNLELAVGVELMVTGFNCGFLAFFWGQLASVAHTPN